MAQRTLSLLAVFFFLLEILRVESFAPSPEMILSLVKTALDDLAPFKKTSLERLHGEVFGTGRASRSTDIVIENKTKFNFRLRDNGCDTGGWTKSMLPEYDIPAHSSVVYGAESYGFLTGVTKCYIRYRSLDRSAKFGAYTSNAYFGPVHAGGEGEEVYIRTVIGRGNNNLVRFYVEEMEDIETSDSEE